MEEAYILYRLAEMDNELDYAIQRATPVEQLKDKTKMTASDFITVAQEEDVVEVLSKHSITLADFTHFVGRIKADIRLREKLYEYSMDDFIKLYRLTYAV